MRYIIAYYVVKKTWPVPDELNPDGHIFEQLKRGVRKDLANILNKDIIKPEEISIKVVEDNKNG